MRFWAGLGFSTGLAGVALLSACSTKELLAPTPAVFTAPQNRLVVDGAQPINASGDLNLLYVTWIDRHSHRAGFKRRHRRYEA